MHLAKDKKGMEFETLISILLLLVGFGLLMYVFATKSAEADRDTQEFLCRGLNAIRVNTEIGIGDFKIGTPRACNTIHLKQPIPTDGSIKIAKGDLNKAAIYDIRDLAVRCWWMWLDGKEPNIFRKRVFGGGGIKAEEDSSTNGFICYTFTISDKVKGKKVGDVKVKSFFSSLENELYYAVDMSDKCGPRGGGFCESDCEVFNKENIKWEEIGSENCKDKCCVPKNARYECVSKGGKCYESCSKLGEEIREEWSQFDRWDCPNDEDTGPKATRCCVKTSDKVSYLDYLQGTGGADTGPGVLLVLPDKDKKPEGMKEEELESIALKSEESYAVTFISPGKGFSWDSLGYTGVALAGAALIAKSATIGAAVGSAVPGAGTAAGFVAGAVAGSAVWIGRNVIIGGLIGLLSSGDIRNINYLVISQYDVVKGKFAESTTGKDE